MCSEIPESVRRGEDGGGTRRGEAQRCVLQRGDGQVRPLAVLSSARAIRVDIGWWTSWGMTSGGRAIFPIDRVLLGGEEGRLAHIRKLDTLLSEPGLQVPITVPWPATGTTFRRYAAT